MPQENEWHSSTFNWDLDPEIEGLPITVQVFADDGEYLDMIALEFTEEQTVRADSFDGESSVSVFAKLTKGFLSKLIQFFSGRPGVQQRIIFRSGTNQFELSGYSPKEAQDILSSGGFKSTLKALKK